MELFSRNIINNNTGKNNIVIIHGLFGMSDNWMMIGKQLAKDRNVYIPDLPNHGNSPHSDNFSIDYLSDEINNFIEENNIDSPIIIGHSLGGRVAINYAKKYNHKISKLIVVDIGIGKLNLNENHIKFLNFVKDFDISSISSFRSLKELITKEINSKRLEQLALKNIKKVNAFYKWKPNFDSIITHFENYSNSMTFDKNIKTMSLFIRGVNSNYVNDNDVELIKNIFTNSIHKDIENAGHWVHVDNTEVFIKVVEDFINK